jgi:hypothetical protein
LRATMQGHGGGSSFGAAQWMCPHTHSHSSSSRDSSKPSWSSRRSKRGGSRSRGCRSGSYGPAAAPRRCQTLRVLVPAGCRCMSCRGCPSGAPVNLAGGSLPWTRVRQRSCRCFTAWRCLRNGKQSLPGTLLCDQSYVLTPCRADRIGHSAIIPATACRCCLVAV